jgi:hypothetical protein
LNRRDLLKRLAGIPMLGVLVPVVAKAARGEIWFGQDAFAVDLASGPDMTVGFVCVNGHPYCNRCVAPLDLSEASLEDMFKQIVERHKAGPIAIKPTHVYVRLHEMAPDTDICIHCHATAELIEEGLEPLGCWRRPA